METDDCATRYNYYIVLCDFWTVYLISNWRSMRIFLYGIYRSMTRHDVDYYEFIFTCSFIILYGKIPENY